MDFYKNKKDAHILSIILFACFIILMEVNLYKVFTDDNLYNYWGVGANLLLAISQGLQIKKYNREKRIVCCN